MGLPLVNAAGMNLYRIVLDNKGKFSIVYRYSHGPLDLGKMTELFECEVEGARMANPNEAKVL